MSPLLSVNAGMVQKTGFLSEQAKPLKPFPLFETIESEAIDIPRQISKTRSCFQYIIVIVDQLT